jgi:hypothetical protein
MQPLTTIPEPPREIKKLSKQQRLFVEAFCGDEVEAMEVAGYSGAETYLRAKARELLKRPHIMQAIKDRSKYLTNMGAAIASKEERQMMWSSIMNNHDPHRKNEYDANNIIMKEGNLPMNVRLKAAELLGKSEGDFIEQININHNITISDIVKESYTADDKSLEDIEADYMVLREQKKKSKEQPQIETYPTDYEDHKDTTEAIIAPTNLGDLI